MTRPDPHSPEAPAGTWRPASLTMFSPVGEVLRREPVTVGLEASVRQALEAMERAGAGSLVVVEPRAHIPLGTFTLQDLVRRVTLPGGSLEQPIAGVMTSGLVTVSPGTSAHQAALTMARHGVRHLVVVGEGGRLAGVVTQDDLFALQRLGVREVSAEIQAAGDLPALQGAARAIRRAAEDLVAQGIAVEALCQFLTTLTDLLTARAMELAAEAHEVPPVPYCWMALGSEGRFERTFASDQDNALVFDAPRTEAPALRALFQSFARAVNDTLDACGIARCAGNFMAGNSRWCLTLDEWRDAFRRWLDEPDPQALVDAAVFFDLRPVHGATALGERLREWLVREAAEHPRFIRALAESAVSRRPPLGLLRTFRYDRPREYPRSLDLKAGGTHLFSDAARVVALARRIPHTSTTQRLRIAGEKGCFSADGLSALVDGFAFLHQLRLRAQCRPRRGPGWANRVQPRALNVMDRQLLRQSLQQAARLQAYLTLEYGLRT